MDAACRRLPRSQMVPIEADATCCMHGRIHMHLAVEVVVGVLTVLVFSTQASRSPTRTRPRSESADLSPRSDSMPRAPLPPASRARSYAATACTGSRHTVKPETQLRHTFEQMLPQGVRSRVAFAVANAAAGSTGDALAGSGGRPLPHRAQHQQEPPLGLAAHLGGAPKDDYLVPLRRCAYAHRRQGVAAAATACASRRRSRTAPVHVLRTQLQHVTCGSGAARLVGRSRCCRNLWRATEWLHALLCDWHGVSLALAYQPVEVGCLPKPSISIAAPPAYLGRLHAKALARRLQRLAPACGTGAHASILNLVARWCGGQCQAQLSLDSPQALCCIAQPVEGRAAALRFSQSLHVRHDIIQPALWWNG